MTRILTIASVLLVAAGCGDQSGTSSAQSIAAIACPSSVPGWAAGTSYATGAVVSYGGRDYQCIQAHTALAGWTPDVVAALWSPVSCSSGGGSSGGGGSSSSGGSSCNAPAWQAQHPYVTGNVVTYTNGQEYIATHDNPGYDPVQSYWYWSPYSCSGGSSGGGTSTGGGGSSCNAPAWQAQHAYVTGDVVKYSNGQEYIATHDNPGYDPTISTWFWSSYACSGGGTSSGGGGGGTSTGGGAGLASYLSEAQFNQMFPSRNSFYTYSGLVAATASYGAFATSGSSDAQKREVAAFLANVAHETGGLVYVEEIVKDVYCQPSADCPCAAGKQYYGRGPIQISWNFNYCAAGKALNLPLQANPDLVAQSATVAWQTGLWYWMTSTGAGSETCHNAMVDGDGFGVTIRTINGSIECNGGNPGEVQDRVQFYQKFCGILGVDPGANLSC